jgi:hypothetical protein
MTLWEIILTLVVLKIPVLYVGWVVWWAIKAVPEVGTQGGTDGVNWTPWRPSPAASPGRPHRGGPQRTAERVRSRGPRPHARIGGTS